jgi:GNAT superfamily N-acetyltransferase
MATVQLETWRVAYTDVLPRSVLDELSDADVEASWSSAITAPPSPVHAVFVALHAGRLIGFVAVGPAGDEDSAADDGEVLELLVGPGFQQAGHASRLLSAAVDHLETSGMARAVTWRLAADDAARQFFSSAGWAADGARRVLDAGEPVEQVRLHAGIGVSVTTLG